MNVKRLVTTAFAAAALAAAAAPSFAQGADGPMLQVPVIALDGQGMVAREEFLAAMGRFYDSKAREMKVKDGKFTAAQMKELLQYVQRAIMAGAGG